MSIDLLSLAVVAGLTFAIGLAVGYAVGLWRGQHGIETVLGEAVPLEPVAPPAPLVAGPPGPLTFGRKRE